MQENKAPMEQATLWDVLVDLLFPPRCLLCGRLVPWGSSICPRCCVKPDEVRTHTEPEAFGCEAVCWAADYTGVLRRGMQNFKFRGRRQGTAFFGEMLVCALRKSKIPDNADAVTYVPMPPRRERRRGYNQAKLLADYIAKAFDLPLRENILCRRGRATAHTAGGRQERLDLAAESYHTGQDRLPEGERILLVDDIITTGATMARCAALLRQQGAGQVWAAAPLRTPIPGEEGKTEAQL